MKTDSSNEKYNLKFYNDEILILEKDIIKFSQITLSNDTWLKNIDNLKILKVIFQRFDDTGHEYEKTYNYFKVKDFKIEKK